MQPKFQVIGLQRSGTNFLQQILQRNFDVDAKFQIWKHEHRVSQKDVETLLKQTNLLVVYKHPYKWIESILRKNTDITHKYDVLADKTTKFPIKNHDVDKEFTYDLKKLVLLYNQFHRFWWNFEPHKNVAFFHFRNLVAGYSNSCDFVDFIQYFYNIKRKPNYNIPSVVPETPDFPDSRRKSYSDLTLEYLTYNEINVINQYLDLRITNRFGCLLFTTKQSAERHIMEK